MAEYSYGSSSGAGGGTPEYKIPEFDWQKVYSLAQEQMAPGLSELQRGLQNIQARSYGSPMEMAEAYRGGLRGAGESLGGLQAGATSAAQSLYAPQYQEAVKKSGLDYQTTMKEYYRKMMEDEAKVAALPKADPRGQVPASYSSWAEYDAAVQAATPTGRGFYDKAYSSGGGSGPLGSPLSGPGERFSTSKLTPTVYGAGSEEEYRKAMGYTSGGTSSGWST